MEIKTLINLKNEKVQLHEEAVEKYQEAHMYAYYF
jgi:hypothetical protein